MQPGLKPISKEENVTYSDGPYGRHFRGIAPLGKLFGLVVSSTLERSLIVYQVFEKKRPVLLPGLPPSPGPQSTHRQEWIHGC